MIECLSQNPFGLGCVVAFAVALVAWTVRQQLRGLNKETARTQTLAIATLAIVVLLVGGVETLRQGEVCEAEMREDLLSQVKSMVRMVRAVDVRKLSFTAQDATNACFHSLRAQLIAYARITGYRSIYTQVLRDGCIVFGPESLDPADAQASPPGTVYQQPTAANLDLFKSGEPIIEGPVQDEYGYFVSAFAPVKDPRSGAVVMALGMDIEASDWLQSIAKARLSAMLVTMMVLLVVAVGGEVLQWQKRKKSFPASGSFWLEAGVAAGIGSAITCAVALWAYNIQGHLFRKAFWDLAEIQGRICFELISDIRE